MKKFFSIAICAALCAAMAVTSIAFTLDFSNETDQQSVEFFNVDHTDENNGVRFVVNDAGIGENVTTIYLQNKAEDGGDMPFDRVYENGAAVKFTSEAAGQATVKVSLCIPDPAPSGMYVSINGGEWENHDLSAFQGTTTLSEYTFTTTVAAGENVIKFVQHSFGDAGNGGNGWRIDIAGITVDLPEGGAEQGGEEPAPAENPSTADASVITIAAVACIALAGVVVAKKVK